MNPPELIELRDLRVSAIVGVLDGERVTPQPLALDLDLARSFEEAAAGDELSATTNYADVLTLVTRIVVDGEFLLLETLARRTATAVLDFDPALTQVTVAVRKLRPPVDDDVATVGVRCTVTRP